MEINIQPVNIICDRQVQEAHENSGKKSARNDKTAKVGSNKGCVEKK